MGLFKSQSEKELDSIIQRLEMNMSNYYKEESQAILSCEICKQISRGP